RRRRSRLVGFPLRKGRSRLGYVERLQQIDPWRPALSRTFSFSFGSRGAYRARGAVENRASHSAAAPLRVAASQRPAPGVDAALRPIPLRPSGRPPPIAADADAAPDRGRGRRAAQARIYAGIRIFRLLD